MNAEHRTKDPDIRTLQTLNDGYVRSIEFSDVSWFDEHLAQDFMNSNPDGSLVNRDGFLAHVARPAMLSDFQAKDVHVRILGDVAIIHGRTTYTKADGDPAAGRYTDIWARKQERWLCVAAHVTRG